MTDRALTLAQVNWIDGQVPHSEQFDDFYFNTAGGLQEVEYTFIQPNRLAKRFAETKSEQVFRIAETGFGSGLNFLATAQHWLATASIGAQLHFISFEKHPMTLADLSQAHQAYPELKQAADALQAGYPFLMPGWRDVWMFEGRVRLTLWFGDVLKGLPECDATLGSQVDAWFLDGFSPSKNPEMWQPGLFKQMSRLSHAQTTFSTFTSASAVRRGLQAAGFAVQKANGFGKKREMCFGHLEQVRSHHHKAPWFSRPKPIKPGTAMVVGAGLSGASVAYQLAQAGWEVTVLEQQSEVATEASGNLAGMVYPFITADWNRRSQFYLQGLEATLRTVLPWLTTGEVEGALEGIVQLFVTETSLERAQTCLTQIGLPETLAVWMTASDLGEKVGGTVTAPGLFYPQGGWLNPVSVVQRCLQHPKICVERSQTVNTIERSLESESNQAWSVVTQSTDLMKQQVWRADVVVVATGGLSTELNAQLGLPIRPVKGQVTHLSAEQQCYALQYPVTHGGYSSPCGDGRAVTGATFEAPCLSKVLKAEGHLSNVTTAQNSLPEWLKPEVHANLARAAATDSELDKKRGRNWGNQLDKKPQSETDKVSGRIAFRPMTLDHLPIFGPVADKAWLQEAYVSKSHTQAVYHSPEQRYQHGLYLSNGHGARGLISVFLAAESILADLQGQAPVQPLSLYHATHPARFVIRSWRSGQP